MGTVVCNPDHTLEPAGKLASAPHILMRLKSLGGAVNYRFCGGWGLGAGVQHSWRAPRGRQHCRSVDHIGKLLLHLGLFLGCKMYISISVLTYSRSPSPGGRLFKFQEQHPLVPASSRSSIL